MGQHVEGELPTETDNEVTSHTDVGSLSKTYIYIKLFILVKVLMTIEIAQLKQCMSIYVNSGEQQTNNEGPQQQTHNKTYNE